MRKAALGVDPQRVHAAVGLMRSGDADILTEVLSGRLTLEQALKLARGGRRL